MRKEGTIKTLIGKAGLNNTKNIARMIDNYRIYYIFIIVFVFATLFAPNFFNAFNLTNILRGMSLNAMVAIGFTVVMICGQLDLSIASTLNLGAILVIGLQPKLGWTLSLIIAILAGALVGVGNGLLVTKAKIHSFIVTLGTMTIVQGIIYLYCHGSSLNTTDFALPDWIDKAIIPLLAPRVIITILAVLVFEWILTRTRYGRGFYMIGGNKETAWLAGLKTNRYLVTAFVMSGAMAAFGGALFAISLSSAVPNMGEKGVSPQMIVIAATIIGGTSMAGGVGGVFKSMVAVLTLATLFNALNCFGAGYEVQVFASGLVLAIVVLYEAYALYKQDKLKGQRTELLKEPKDKVLNGQ